MVSKRYLKLAGTKLFHSNRQVKMDSKTVFIILVVPTYLEILIGYALLIQPFDWAHNLSKPIFYPTISIQWSNLTFDFGILKLETDKGMKTKKKKKKTLNHLTILKTHLKPPWST